jgi:hypothetical protein
MPGVSGQKPGRPPGSAKLTPELAEAIVTLVRCGQPLAAAAAIVGVSDRSVRRWRHAGETAPTGSPERDLFLGVLVAQAGVTQLLSTATAERARMRA